MARYLPSVKRYSWVMIACVVVAAVAGLLVLRVLPPAYLASTTLVVQAPSGGAVTSALTTNATQNIAESNTYAAEVPSRGAMTVVSHLYPELAKHGYTITDLMHAVTATPSTSAGTITIQAAGKTPHDAVMIANDVALGFNAYVAQQAQAQVNSLRHDLQTQLDSYQQTKDTLEKKVLQSRATTTTTTSGRSNSNNSNNGSNSNNNITGIGSTNSTGSSSSSTSTTTTTSSDPAVAVYLADLANLNQTIASLQGQLATLPMTAAGDTSVIQLATPADVTPSAKPLLVALATLAAGLILGALLMWLIIYLDRRLLGEDQVKEKLGLAYFGGLSRDTTLAASPAMAADTPAQECANIYAGMRLAGLAPASGRTSCGRIILVTSPRAGEGKTTFACALAGSIARAGSTVALVDANLRQPAAHLSLGVTTSGLGLSGLLTSEGPVEEALLQAGDTPGLWLLPAGDALHIPTLLLQERLPEILAQIRQKVDMVIVDGPSLLDSADATLLANMVDQVTMVVDARRDQLGILERACELLTTLSSTPVGVVLNFLSPTRRNHYYASALLPSVQITSRAPALVSPDRLVAAPALPSGNGNTPTAGALSGE